MTTQPKWTNLLHAWMTEQARATWPSFTATTAQIAGALGTSPRIIFRATRQLKDRNLIDIQHNPKEEGGLGANTYTMLPLEADRMQKVVQLGALLNLSKGEAARAICRLVATPYNPLEVTLQDVADIAGYTGSPLALVTALKTTGLIRRDGTVGW